MDRRTHLQLRLQQTVEGLSVVAISYYLVALVGYLVGPIHAVSHDVAVAVAVPVVVLGVALSLWQMRQRLHDFASATARQLRDALPKPTIGG